MLDTIMMYLGYAVTVAVLGILFLAYALDYDRTDDYTLFKLLGFGFLIVRSKRLIKNARKIRKNDKAGKQINDAGDVLFFDAPKWFNKLVYNFGVK